MFELLRRISFKVIQAVFSTYRFLMKMFFMLQGRDDQPPPAKRRKQHRDMPSSREPSRTGKIRGAILPQEYDLERLVADISPRHSSWTVAIPACKWEGVTCNEQEEVTEINLDLDSFDSSLNGELSGLLHLQHLPRTVLRTSVTANCFSGSDILIICLRV